MDQFILGLHKFPNGGHKLGSLVCFGGDAYPIEFGLDLLAGDCSTLYGLIDQAEVAGILFETRSNRLPDFAHFLGCFILCRDDGIEKGGHFSDENTLRPQDDQRHANDDEQHDPGPAEPAGKCSRLRPRNASGSRFSLGGRRLGAFYVSDRQLVFFQVASCPLSFQQVVEQQIIVIRRFRNRNRFTALRTANALAGMFVLGLQLGPAVAGNWNWHGPSTIEQFWRNKNPREISWADGRRAVKPACRRVIVAWNRSILNLQFATVY
jgi:hypothetical protein